MHPPFGFALFYLRSVAPDKEYVDKLTGKLTAPVTTGQIYWGAIPFVIIQLVMVALVIVFPQMVLVYKDEASTVDPNSIRIDVPMEPAPTDQTPSPDFGTPPAPAPGSAPGASETQAPTGSAPDTAPAPSSPPAKDDMTDLFKK